MDKEQDKRKSQRQLRARRRRQKRKKLKIKPRFYFFLVLLLMLAILIIKLMSGLFKDTSYQDAINTRYNPSSNYMTKLNEINSFYVRDNNTESGKSSNIEGIWRNMKEIALEEALTMELLNFMKLEQIPKDKLSISIVSVEQGDKFNFNQEKQVSYPRLDNLLLAMSLQKADKDGHINLNDTITMIEEDLTESTYFFETSSIGVDYQIKELINLYYKHQDKVASNMISRYTQKKIEKNPTQFINDSFSIQYSYNQSSTEDLLKIAREFNTNPSLYINLLNDQPEKQTDQLYLNYLYIGNAINYLYNQEPIFYDFGYIDSQIDYIYSIHAEDLSVEHINQIADLLDRKINSYYLMNNL